MPAETHMERQSLDRDAVLQLLKEQLADIMESDVDAIGEDDRFAEDLHTDSLALVELVEVLEDELAERSCAVLFDDEDLVDLLTVRDAVDYVMARMGSWAPPSRSDPAPWAAVDRIVIKRAQPEPWPSGWATTLPTFSCFV